MSHFPVLVIGEDINTQLAPYDENMSVEPYLASMDGEWQEALSKARFYYAEHDLETDTTGWTDQQLLDGYYSKGYWTPAQGGGFEHWSEYNPRSKWDWFVIGGRWDGEVIPGNEALVRDLNLDTLPIPFAFVKDGEWYEKGRMGWWGIVTESMDDEVWDAEVRKALKDLPGNTKLTLIDCHI